ncbi:MAG: nitrilase-related carbon-nitrogen hydrolase, partial [Pirellulales bacterium]
NMPIHELDKQRGSGFPVFDTADLGSVGMLICYDMVFPEAPRCLALAGADMIFHPTLGGAAIGAAELSLAAFRTRAVENFVYIVVAQRGSGSMIISPRGKVLAEAEGQDSLAIADIDPRGGREGGDALNHQADMRARLFRERSPEAFGILTEREPPVLRKAPETIGIADAVRVGAGTLTVGEERFKAAEALARAGERDEAMRAFQQLTRDFPYTWIDRVSRERLVANARLQLRSEQPPAGEQSQRQGETNASPGASDGARAVQGPLRVHPANGRYFTDDRGKAIYMTGAHTWNNLVDMGRNDPPEAFDFDAYLDFLERHGHSFIRLWAWDSVTWDTRANGDLGKDFVHHVAPLPWPRTGPGKALDGKPKFDLAKFDPAYFERLRARVSGAGRRGIYVSVMLFEGWCLYHANRGRATPEGWAWRAHPFHPDNNINGINADVDGDGITGEVHRLASPAVNAIQAAYIRKVVDTVNDLDNVLYEVINEGGEKEWDWWVVKTIKDYQRTKPKQHPVGITGHGAEKLASMLASPADWTSPGRVDGYAEEPPAWDGKKVSLLDTDHIWGVGGNAAWVWKSFLRGHNPIFMDPYDGAVLGTPSDPRWEPIRSALGHSRRVAERVDLAACEPRGELASTQYCLANPGKEYLVYLPEGGEATVDLSAVEGRLAVEWFNPRTGERASGEKVDGGARRTLRAPFDGDAVLYLRGDTK